MNAISPTAQYLLNDNLSGPVTADIMCPFTQTEPDHTFCNFELKRALIFYNPCAAGGANSSVVSNLVIPILHESNISTIAYPTKCRGDLTQYLRNKKEQILSYKVDAFVVVGGDGTFHEFVNGYITANYKAFNIAVIFMNGGSGNSLCLTMSGIINTGDHTKLKRYLGHIVEQTQAQNIKKRVQWIDAIEFKQNNSVIKYAASQSYFGISSATAHWAEWQPFKTIFGASSLRYDVAAMIEMSKHREYKLKFTFCGLQNQNREEVKHKRKDDNTTLELITTIEMFVAMKGKYFGKGLCITPFAKLDNGYLDVLILERLESRLKLISIFLRLQNIKNNLDVILEKEGILYYRCKEVTIEVLDSNDNIVTDTKQLKDMRFPDVGCDGEIGPYLPLTIKAVQHSIPVLFPNPKLFD